MKQTGSTPNVLDVQSSQQTVENPIESDYNYVTYFDIEKCKQATQHTSKKTNNNGREKDKYVDWDTLSYLQHIFSHDYSYR